MSDQTDAFDRIARLLALNLVKDLPQADQIARLDSCGFATHEVAKLVGTTEATVRATKSATARKKSRSRKSS